jgi:hypothetical protein
MTNAPESPVAAVEPEGGDSEHRVGWLELF